jgi:hypothetical protein
MPNGRAGRAGGAHPDQATSIDRARAPREADRRDGWRCP